MGLFMWGTVIMVLVIMVLIVCFCNEVQYGGGLTVISFWTVWGCWEVLCLLLLLLITVSCLLLTVFWAVLFACWQCCLFGDKDFMFVKSVLFVWQLLLVCWQWVCLLLTVCLFVCWQMLLVCWQCVVCLLTMSYLFVNSVLGSIGTIPPPRREDLVYEETDEEKRMKKRAEHEAKKLQRQQQEEEGEWASWWNLAVFHIEFVNFLRENALKNHP